MERIREIIKSSTEPTDKHVLWIKDGKPMIFDGGWKPMVADSSSGDDSKKELFIDLWNDACGDFGTYNRETGFFELNGLTDITYEEALKIYNSTVSLRPEDFKNLIVPNVRTHLPFLITKRSVALDVNYTISDVVAISSVDENTEFFINLSDKMDSSSFRLIAKPDNNAPSDNYDEAILLNCSHVYRERWDSVELPYLAHTIIITDPKNSPCFYISQTKNQDGTFTIIDYRLTNIHDTDSDFLESLDKIINTYEFLANNSEESSAASPSAIVCNMPLFKVLDGDWINDSVEGLNYKIPREYQVRFEIVGTKLLKLQYALGGI